MPEGEEEGKEREVVYRGCGHPWFYILPPSLYFTLLCFISVRRGRISKISGSELAHTTKRKPPPFFFSRQREIAPQKKKNQKGKGFSLKSFLRLKRIFFIQSPPPPKKTELGLWTFKGSWGGGGGHLKMGRGGCTFFSDNTPPPEREKGGGGSRIFCGG